ncbi:MAG: FKBP-type peptidyl-prolyl cis-trans isomerase [Coriobacteriales bacterium]|jgi:peptidylprolyl isomerase|nr:FKBP-type peptidyl-prolyl cis-trans isomerase [Coriobacteriales bacterium]
MRVLKAWKTSALAVVLCGALALGLVGCIGGGPVAATINGEDISESTITEIIMRSRATVQSDEEWVEVLRYYGRTPETLRETVIKSEAQVFLIKEQAAEKGLKADEKKADAEVAKSRNIVGGTAEDWLKALNEKGFADENDYRETILIGDLQMQLADALEVEPTTEELSAFVAVNQTATYRSSAIILQPSDKLTQDDITKLVAEIQQKLKDGAEFAALAKEYSTDKKSAEKGGDMGWDLVLLDLDENYVETLWELKVGEVSKPIKGSDDFFNDSTTILIQCTEIYEPNPEKASENAKNGTEEQGAEGAAGNEGAEGSETEATEKPAEEPEADAPTVDLKTVPEGVVEFFKKAWINQNKAAAFKEFIEKKLEEADLVINPMPKNLPYDVDMGDPYPGSTKEAVDAALEGGLIIEDLEEGTGEAAEGGSIVEVYYTGTLEDGTVFDSNVDTGEPFKLVLGSRSVIPGWDAGLVGMKAGGKRKLTIPAGLAYGEQGQGSIPPNATLYFEITLVSVTAHDVDAADGDEEEIDLEEIDGDIELETEDEAIKE